MVWIKEYKSTSAQNKLCSAIIYSRLPSNALCNLTRTNALCWSNTWDTWEKRASGMLSRFTPVSVAGEKRQWKAEMEWKEVIRQKNNKTKNPRRRIPRSMRTDWDSVLEGGERTVVQTDVRAKVPCCQSAEKQLVDLFIYVGADRVLHR